MFPKILPYMVERERVRTTVPNPVSSCSLSGKQLENKPVLEPDVNSHPSFFPSLMG